MHAPLSSPQAPHTPSSHPTAATPPSGLTWQWATEDDTQAFAQRLAQLDVLGNVLITLHGDLGAGKTTLVRHLLRALGVTGRIKSPTYAVVEPYEVAWPWSQTPTPTHADTIGHANSPANLPNRSQAASNAATPHETHPTLGIWHFDFYRLGDPREWEDAGLRDLLASPGLKLVEWPDKAGPGMPTPDLSLHLQSGEGDHRQATLAAHTEAGQQCLHRLDGATPATASHPTATHSAPVNATQPAPTSEGDT